MVDMQVLILEKKIKFTKRDQGHMVGLMASAKAFFVIHINMRLTFWTQWWISFSTCVTLLPYVTRGAVNGPKNQMFSKF